MLASGMPDESRPVALSLPRSLLATTLPKRCRVGMGGFVHGMQFFVERVQSI